MSVVAPSLTTLDKLNAQLAAKNAEYSKYAEDYGIFKDYRDYRCTRDACRQENTRKMLEAETQMKRLNGEIIDLKNQIASEEKRYNTSLVAYQEAKNAEAEANPDVVRARATGNVKKFLAIGGAVSIVIAVGIFMFFKYRK